MFRHPASVAISPIGGAGGAEHQATAAHGSHRGGDEGARRRQLLDAALGVFLELGFRKTSMDDVARAASVSRQGLYLHFSKKEELFKAVVQHALEGAFRAAEQQLRDGSRSVRDRLTGAFDAWVGRYVGMLGRGVTDLGEATHTLVGPLLRQYGDRFVELLAKFMRSSGLLAAYKPAGLTARQLAETLYATARGFKTECSTRDEFIDAIGKAVRAFCLPLGGGA
jgi:TetR/AcrR family transcriptional regulator of autoinduction and epiphytic fitness